MNGSLPSGKAQSPTPKGSSSTADPSLAGARSALQRGDWTAADAALRQVLSRETTSPEALYLLALALFHENKATASLENFTKAAAQRRPSAEDLRYVALDYVLLGDFNDAEKWIAHSVADDPLDGESWYAQGRIQYTNQNFLAARASFERALKLLPHSVKAENNLGLTLEGLNEPEAAIAAYRQAIAWVAGDAEQNEQPFLNLGILLTDRGQLDEALALLQRGEALAPKDGRLHGALGKLYARRGELPRAQGELEQAVAAAPNDAALHFQLGQVYRREGMPTQAAEQLKLSSALEQKARH